MVRIFKEQHLKLSSMIFRHLVLTLILVSGLLLPGYSQQPERATTDIASRIAAVEKGLFNKAGDTTRTLSERMAFYKIKGVSIAVISHYQIEWVKAYGWADEDAKTPVTPQTLFQAASISKSLNAVGVLKLVQEHRLDLATDINQYLKSWTFPYDSVAKNKKITLNELLSHTAGLSVHGFAGYQRGMPIPTIVQILDGRLPANSPPIRSMFEPGLRSVYSGGGITISQLIVEDLTGQDYARFMKEQVLKPLGMGSSSYEQPYTHIDSILLATGYNQQGNAIPGKYHIYPEQAAAGLWTNPTELARYVIETQLALEGKSHKVLDEAMTRVRLTPYIDSSAALGVFISIISGTRYFQHGGANEGFRSQYMGSLEGGNGIVIMVNSDQGAIIPEIMNSIIRVYGWTGQK